MGLGGRDHEELSATAFEVTRAGGRAIAVEGDVTRAADVEKLVAATEAAYGPVDILVRVACMGGARRSSHPAR